MNEDSRDNSLMQTALQTVGAGTVAYGGHRLATGEMANNYINKNDNLRSKILKGYGNGTSKATNFVKDFFTAEDTPKSSYVAAYSKEGRKMNFKNNLHRSTSYNGLIANSADEVKSVIATIPNKAKATGRKKLAKVAKTFTKKL